MGFGSGLEVILSLWPRVTSSSVRLCVGGGGKGRGGGGFLDDHLCQAREQAWEQRRHGQLTLAFLSLVPTWAVTVFWERKGHSEVSSLL